MSDEEMFIPLPDGFKLKVEPTPREKKLMEENAQLREEVQRLRAALEAALWAKYAERLKHGTIIEPPFEP